MLYVVLADSPVIKLVKEPVPLPSTVWFPAMVGLAAMPQQTPLAVTGLDPPETTFPPEVAEVNVIALAAVVVTANPNSSQAMVADHPALVTEPSLVNLNVKAPVAFPADAVLIPGLVLPWNGLPDTCVLDVLGPSYI